MNDKYQLYQGDCLKVMKTFEDNSIDCVITDPPYGINVANTGSYGGGGLNPHGRLKGYGKIFKPKQYPKGDWDNKIPSKEYFNEMIRISKNQIIFGGNYFVEYLKNSPCWIVWDKDNSGDFADCELAWTSFNTAVRKFKWRWNGMLQENMKRKEFRFHPTQKPVELFSWILTNYTEPDQTILDPFMGSGTTGVSCMRLNRKFIGIEMDEQYFKVAKNRIAEADHNLFNLAV